jgi:hypothetical protein
MFLLQETQQLLLGILLQTDSVTDIGSVEPCNKLIGAIEIESVNDLLAGALVSSGSQGNAGNTGKLLVQQAQLQVIGSEVVLYCAPESAVQGRCRADPVALVAGPVQSVLPDPVREWS